MESLGPHQWWGYSPALDLLEVDARARAGIDAEEDPKVVERDEATSFLLVQPGDVRHILKTMAQRRRHGRDRAPDVQFYVHEEKIEQIARHLLLLAVAFDWTLPIRKRANVWLEIFGNALIQERTRRYIAAKRVELIKLLCDNEGPLSRIIDLSMLRYRERDALEDTFKSWDMRADFNMAELRDTRTRRHYGTRYDFRNNLMDWDFNKGVHIHNGQIHSREFRGWRENGVAFEFGDETYTMGNPSLASYAEGRDRTGSKLVRGYWGDIVASPYHALGTSASIPSKHEVGDTLHKNGAGLFDINSRHSGAEMFRHTGTDLSVYNVLSYLWELETGRRYVMRESHELYSGLGHELVDAKAAREGVSREATDGDRARAVRRARSIAGALRGVKITFLCGPLKEWTRRKRMAGVADCVVVSARSVDVVKEESFALALKEHCSVLLELARNMVVLSSDQQAEFERQAFSILAGKLGVRLTHADRFGLTSDAMACGSTIEGRPDGGRGAPRECGAPPPPPRTAAEAALVEKFGIHGHLLFLLRRLAEWNPKGGDNPRPTWVAGVYDRNQVSDTIEAFQKTLQEIDALRPESIKEALKKKETGDKEEEEVVEEEEEDDDSLPFGAAREASKEEEE